MIKENDVIKEDDQENSEKINLSHFNYLIANKDEIIKYLEIFKECLLEYYNLNLTQYTSLSKLCNGLSSEEMNPNFINTPIYQLKLIFQKLVDLHSKKYESMMSEFHKFIFINEKISKLEKIINEINVKHNNLTNFGLDKTICESSNSIMQYMNDLEMKIVDEFIWKKYKKNTLISSNESIENLVDLIKNLEKTIYDYGSYKKGEYFSIIKQSHNKIQSIYNDIKNNFVKYISHLKDTTKNYLDELEKFEKNISSISINLDIKNCENIFCSKSDFEFKEKDFNKYPIKILKSKKVFLKNPKDINDTTKNSFSFKKSQTYIERPKNTDVFEENVLYLDEQDIYEIISKLYSFNLHILDKSNYNLDEEKGKLTAMELSEKILSYSENKETVENKLNSEYKGIMEIIDTKILNNILNAQSFFLMLNNYRATGKLNFNEKFYEIILYIYDTTQKLLMKKSNYKLGNIMLVLSQTFYKKIKGEKIYILEGIKSHELYKQIDFWKNIILKKIDEELKIMKKVSSANIINQEKKDELILSKLFPFCQLMKEFNFEKEKISNLSTLILDKYKSSKTTREQIDNYIKNIL